MDIIGNINERLIYYLSVEKTTDWADKLPNKNWLVVPICDRRDTALIDKVVQACLDKNVLYVCAIGQECEWAHDWFDETILTNRINKKLPISCPDDFDEEPMTTWHDDFVEGLWFAATAAFPSINDEYIYVDKVVCLDLTDKANKEYLTELTIKINSGWLPSNTD
jgi:hypothetical protein